MARLSQTRLGELNAIVANIPHPNFLISAIVLRAVCYNIQRSQSYTFRLGII